MVAFMHTGTRLTAGYRYTTLGDATAPSWAHRRSQEKITNPTSAIRRQSHITHSFEVSQVLFRLSRWENLEYAKKI